jgi:hypothetical protein
MQIKYNLTFSPYKRQFTSGFLISFFSIIFLTVLLSALNFLKIVW